MDLISIIYVNYESSELICNSITSVLLYEDKEYIELIVVNNGGDVSVIEEAFPFIKIVDNCGNNGFSSANNKGALIATGKFILFLNPDTVFVESILRTMTQKLLNDSSIGILGCQLLNQDKTLQLSYHNGDRVFQKLWHRNPFSIKLFSATKKIEKRKANIIHKHQAEHCAPWLSGACMMLRKSDIEQYGWQWDEDFFMYWEDVELSYRVRKKGFHVVYFPSVKLIHIGGGGDPNVSYSRFSMMEHAKLIFIQKTRGKFVKLIYVLSLKLELRLERFLSEKKRHQDESILDKEIEFYFNRK